VIKYSINIILEELKWNTSRPLKPKIFAKVLKRADAESAKPLASLLARPAAV
jgi:hypothetical protein